MNSRTPETDNKHGNRCMSERRLSIDEQISFYKRQAQLAWAGIVTRHPPEYFERQVMYFEAVKAGTL